MAKEEITEVINECSWGQLELILIKINKRVTEVKSNGRSFGEVMYSTTSERGEPICSECDRYSHSSHIMGQCKIRKK